MPSFAELLKTYLKRSSLRPADLAKKIKVRRDILLEWMTDEISLPLERDEVLRCATHLNLNLGESDELLLAAKFEPEGGTVSFAANLPISLTS